MEYIRYDGFEIKAEQVMVKTPELDYLNRKKQGEYTVEDYFAFSEEIRVELIDGVIYKMNTPSYIHQSISAAIYIQLNDYIERKGGNCVPFYAPCSVQLDQDDRTMVQPDVMVVCKRDLIRRSVYYGAPDFVIEILSPSTRRRDMHLKLRKYRNAGVREYWMVDPDKKSVIVYHFDDGFHAIYGFGDKIPVHIYDGDCVIDFARVYERTRFLYERDDEENDEEDDSGDM